MQQKVRFQIEGMTSGRASRIEKSVEQKILSNRQG